MPNCLKCNKPLRAIGRNRKNGKDFKSGANFNKDWKERQYHKKCWKEHQDDIMWDFMIKEKELERMKKENELMKEIITNTDNKKEKNKEELQTKIENDKFVVRFK
tara:strand:- start:187 stop:501 length:315 start_codon:yes stop_codon:yes gene_type:complete